jgi:hypothetical protein
MISSLIRGDRKRRYILLLSLGAVISLISAHLYVVAKNGDYVGPLIILDHFFNMGLVVALLTVCAAVGLWLQERFRLTFDTPLEALLFFVAIGSSAVGASILILGLLSGLQPITLASVMVLWALLARCEIVTVCQLIAEASIEIKKRGDVLSLTVFAIVGGFMISQALLPPRDWDSLMYHLRVPLQFLQAGKIYLPEDNLHAAFVQLVHMLYLPLLAFRSYSGPALTSTCFGLFLGLASFAVASRFLEGKTAPFCQTLLWVSPVIPLIAITPRIDVTLAFFLLLTHLALLKAQHHEEHFNFAAVLLGTAIGIKHNAFLYGLGLTPLILHLVCVLQNSWNKRINSLAVFCAIVLATASPWLIKNWLLFDSPIYPFLAQRRVDGWLSFLYSEEVYAELVNPQIWTSLTEAYHRFDLWNFITNKVDASLEREAIQYTISPLFLCLCLLLRREPANNIRLWLVIPAFVFLTGTVMSSTSVNIRYLVPVLAPFTLVSADLLIRHCNSLLTSRKSAGVCKILAVVLLLPTLQMMFNWTLHNLSIKYFLGLISRENYLKQHVFPPDHAEYYHAVSYINRNNTGINKVLMLFEARGLYSNVPVIQDNLLTNWALLAGKISNLNCLQATNISHVLLYRAALDYNLKRGLNPAATRWAEFQSFADNCLVPVYYGANGYVLYRITK